MSGAQASVKKPLAAAAGKTVFTVIFAVGFCHLLNDMMQSLLPAIYPVLKAKFHLSFVQVGLVTFTYQITASLLQPIVGLVADRRPMPWSLGTGMLFTLVGLVSLGLANSFSMLLVSSAVVGIGSSVFHPESSRVARMASGGRHGLAQALFQVGGNFGSSLGPLLAAFVVLAMGQKSIAWFSLLALLASAILFQVGRWYKENRVVKAKGVADPVVYAPGFTHGRTIRAIAILLALIFSKYFYLASITSYYTFYLIHHFHVSVQSAQLHLFLFLAAVAAGTVAGGPIGDRWGRKYVIWFSILGVLPFTLLLPHVDLLWTSILSVVIGLLLASAFPAIVVFGQELLPGRVGMVAGMFFGFSFGMGGIGAALIGWLADVRGIDFAYQVCAFLPVIGILTAFLPNMHDAGVHENPAIAT